MTYPPPNWNRLQQALVGEAILPGSPGYDSARKPAIPRFAGIRPTAVVLAASPEDVAATIAFAREHGIPAVPRSGGHSFAGHSSTEGIVIDVSPMRSVAVNDGLATIGAGARLGEVYDALDAHGLTIPAGCGPTVGIAGLALGGGFGILGRAHGLLADQLVRAEVVLADGRIVVSDAETEPDLFWALRGAGGGAFGVVTSLTFRTIPAPQATVFHLTWPVSHAAEIITAWQDWAPTGPDELAASLLLTAFGQDAASVHLFGAMIAGEQETAAQLEAFTSRLSAQPTTRIQRQLPYREAKRYLTEHGPGEAEAESIAINGFSYSKSEYFRQSLPAEAIDALVAHLLEDRRTGEIRILDLSPWGGAYNRVAADATAFPHRDESFLLKQELIIDPTLPPDAQEAGLAWLRRSWELAHAHGAGGVYPNFPDTDLPAWDRAYHGDNLGRLLEIKRAYDPDNFFRPGLPRPALAR